MRMNLILLTIYAFNGRTIFLSKQGKEMKRIGNKKGMMFFNLKYFVLHKICSIFAI